MQFVTFGAVVRLPLWRRCSCTRGPTVTATHILPCTLIARRHVARTTSGTGEPDPTPRQTLRRRGRRRRTGNMVVATDAALLPRSLDIAEVETSVDVERNFASVMAHLKDVPRVSHVADDAARQRWHDITHTRDADGTPTTTEERVDEARTFFDQDSLDIRGGEAAQARHAASLQERNSPDVLRLTGGSVRRDGLGLAERSNDAPADQTLEDDAGGDVASGAGEFGDAPVQLTDMLRERLMELKADKLKEERSDTFMPRRLQLESDAALRQRHMRPSCCPAATRTTLADLCPTNDMDATGVEADGADAARRVLQGVASYMPGGHHPPSSVRHAGAARQPVDAASETGGAAREAAEWTGSHTAQADGAASLGDGREGVYLLRLLPRACLCSRREAVALVASGQVRVNNVVERNPFRLVRAEDDVHVAGQPSRLRFAPPRLWIYHKPSYVIASRNDPAGRSLITRHARLLGLDHLIPIGALPMRAHGVMLLTNDGELAQFLQNPATMMQRTYLLRVRPAVDPVLAHRLNTEGININGRQYRDAEFFVNPAIKSRFSLKVKVRGETMPIAHLLQHLGRTVERGGRISFGPFALSGLAVGSVREVTVPPFYATHAGAVWQPFVERDWPFFRRQRVARLRRLSRFRELTPKEVEELDSFSYDELRDALSFESSELATMAAERNAQLARRPAVAVATALERDFGLPAESDVDAANVNTLSFAPDEPIFEDITAAP